MDYHLKNTKEIIMKKILILLSLTLSFLHAESESIKVVYDLTTSNVTKFEKYILKGIVMNSEHYHSQLKELEVSVVIHGGAYKYFVKDLPATSFKNDTNLSKVYTELKKRVATLADTYDVEFLMCRAGMKKNRLIKKDIVEYVTIIPNASIGLIDKQNEGFAYLPAKD